MNSQEALVQIEALEAALVEEQRLREQFEQQLKDQRARAAELQADFQTYKSDIWSIAEVQQALDAVSRTGSEFVIHMDHRLRTTVNGLLGMIDLLMHCDLTDEEQEFAMGASTSGQELVRMLNDILDYCRMDAGHIELARDNVRGDDLLAEFCGPFGELARERGIALEATRTEAVPEQLTVDRQHLNRALRHLIENAVRHTSHGSVTVKIDAAGKGADAEVLVSVADTGEGIAPEDLARACEPFERMGNEGHQGVGLGLTIVRRLAELMGGRFELVSELGVGSTATLHFPLHAVSEQAALSKQDSELGGAQAQARILVVEDNEVNQKVAVGFLKMIGCQLETAENGLDAIEKLSEGEFDMILMDCMMPEVDGYEATRRIRGGAAGEAQATIPIVALTADDSAGARQSCLRAGMDDYMSKPVRIDRLRSMLRIWLPPSLRPAAE